MHNARRGHAERIAQINLTAIKLIFRLQKFTLFFSIKQEKTDRNLRISGKIASFSCRYRQKVVTLQANYILKLADKYQYEESFSQRICRLIWHE